MTMIHANAGSKQPSKTAGTQPFCPNAPPSSEENAPSYSPRYLLGAPRVMQFCWDAARVKLGARGRRQVIARLGCSPDASGGKLNWSEPPWGEKARGGACAASLLAEFARPPSSRFRTRHGPRQLRHEGSGYWDAIVLR